MDRCNQRCVQLEKGLAPGANDISTLVICQSPSARNGVRERVRCAELSAANAIGADEICVAETADRRLTIAFKSAPEIAPRKTQKYGRPSRARAFTLKRVIDFLCLIRHRWRNSAKPFARNSQAGQLPQP